jgi:succinate dehydrogenase / fumarate reductase cytochrome b subunit
MGKLKYALFVGCTPKQSTPELMKSTLAIAKEFDIELVELVEATCCGASHMQDFDDFLSLVLNARNIAYAEQRGLTMVTLCNTCQLNTANTKHRLDNDPKLKQRVNDKLGEVGLKYEGTSPIKHFLYALIDDFGIENIAAKVKKPLTNINIAPFYGCHNIRPAELHHDANGGENPYNPTSLDRLIVALGGNSVQYGHKNKCCGFHVELQAPKTANRVSGSALLDAIDNNADGMVTPCPLCHLRLDVQQKNIEKEVGREVTLPILHMPQMVGLALGLDPKELGIEHNVTKVDFVN